MTNSLKRSVLGVLCLGASYSVMASEFGDTAVVVCNASTLQVISISSTVSVTVPSGDCSGVLKVYQQEGLDLDAVTTSSNTVIYTLNNAKQ